MEVVKGGKGKTIKEQAQKEIAEERTAQYVSKLKTKLRELESAKIVVSNLEREVADLELKIDQETNAIG